MDFHYKRIIDVISYVTYNFARKQICNGEVLELADRRDLGSRAERREGSTPSFPIIIVSISLLTTY